MKIFLYLLISDFILCANWKGLNEEIPSWFRSHDNPLSTWFWKRVVERIKICDKQELELEVKNEENNSFKEKILANITSFELINCENYNLQKEIDQFKQELSSKLDVISKLEAQLATKNLEIEQVRIETTAECQLKFSQEFPSKLINFRQECNVDSEQLNHEVLKKPGDFDIGKIELIGRNIEINTLRQEMSTNLTGFEKLKLKFFDKISQFDCDVQAGQSEIDDLCKLFKELLFEIAKFKNTSDPIPNSIGPRDKIEPVNYFWM